MESPSWIEPGLWWGETKVRTATMENSKEPLNKDGILPYTSFSSIFYNLCFIIFLSSFGPSKFYLFISSQTQILVMLVILSGRKELEESWPMVEASLEKYGISCTLSLAESSITFSTTTRTRCPDIVDKARELLQLLALTCVPPSEAIQVLSGSLQYDIIWTGSHNGGLYSKLSFRDRGRYLFRMKSIQLNLQELSRLSACSIYLNGISVTVMGTSPEAFKVIRHIVEGCVEKGHSPGTTVRLINLCIERKGQMDNLEMDAYGFETVGTITMCNDVRQLKPSDGNTQVDHEKSELFANDPAPEVEYTRRFIFGPSLNKDGMLDLACLSGCWICRNRATVTALGTSPEGFKLVRFVVRRCIVNNANPTTLLRKIKRRRELQKRDGAGTSPIVLAERELNLDQVLWEVQSELENESLSSDLEI
ncbi:hypothetical protein M0R45_025976 [Rubus argutus]|uniref:KRR-R motif-containing protein 1 n=1 Tax=Rubus argutus TaxID=59490 RepID=A0AAW1WWV5_RUBAR